jgi:replicative DNA helicase
MSVLGAMLLGDATATEEAAELLSDADFYRPAHGRIFRSMQDLCQRREPVDIVTLKTALETEGILDAIGGIGYLIQLGEFVPTTASVLHYGEIVKKMATLRRLIEMAGEIAGLAYARTESVESLIDRAESQIFALRPDAKNAGPRRAVEVASDVFDAIEARQAAGGGLIGESTGFAPLDWYTSGLQAGNLYLIAARPSMGKTSAAVNIAASLARDGGRVAFFSLEMSAEELVENVLTAEAPIDGTRLRLGNLSGAEWATVASPRMLDEVTTRLIIDDTAVVTPGYMRSACRKMARRYGPLSAIFVDYIQLMTTGGDGANRTEELSQISRALKLLGKEMDCPVIALAQLSRRVEQREDKRPMLSDLRDSGGLEADADVVVFLYRASYYARKEEASGETERDRIAADPTEFIIAKNRKGATGMAKLGFKRAYRKFVELSDREDFQ